MRDIADRMIAIVNAETPEGRRFKALEEFSQIPAVSWRKAYLRGQRPTAEMIEAVSQRWPQYAFWLVTGITDPERNHIAPATAASGYPVMRGVEQPWATREFCYLIAARKSEPTDDVERMVRRRQIQDAALQAMEKVISPAANVSYEKAMRVLGESGQHDFYPLALDPEYLSIRKARRDAEDQLRKDGFSWFDNVLSSVKIDKRLLQNPKALLSKVFGSLFARQDDHQED
ncbi:hypothetical protein B7L17_019800 [Burkholderia cenocepacia]|uniref:hypothetical protein n=1 Tax=Burkholderia cenocepacia TaxID=95486 RepID=UPI0022374723|nr:hypothetical protein [Burkholderia cenocepacia]MCW5119982.1 hypothetical protein [Burkholderia cenocepacia]MCW5132515.1 hypothetical protein [Burkholderia cenocepacia]MCW5175189.1 hypothetical protein [Burkholderia cenocepacia]